MPDSLLFHGLQHASLLCPSLSPRVCWNSCPLSRWCHSTISSSVTPFSFCPQSFPASGSFSMIWLFTSGGQSIGASTSALALPMNIQGWFPLGDFPCGSAGKESICNVGDLGSVPELGRSPGEGKGYTLQYSGLENSMGCIVYGALEKDMAIHSSILA